MSAAWYRVMKVKAKQRGYKHDWPGCISVRPHCTQPGQHWSVDIVNKVTERAPHAGADSKYVTAKFEVFEVVKMFVYVD